MIDDADSNSGFLVDLPFHPDESPQQFTQLTEIPTESFSRVVKARRYGRWWILKGLQPEYECDPMYREALRKEFDITISLQHPNIVSASSIEEVEGLGSCIVMEWVDALTLKDWLAQKCLSRSRKRRVFSQLLDALEYVHSLQIVHRDLKPSNILITRNGEHVKLIDFGLGDTDSHAMLKQPAGSPGYLAPEQSSSAIPDVRNDIYSLGCILRDMQMGHRGVVARCLKPIEKRYASVSRLRSALRKERFAKVTAGVAIAIALAVGIAIVVAQWGAPKKSLPEPVGNVASYLSPDTAVGSVVTGDEVGDSAVKDAIPNEVANVKAVEPLPAVTPSPAEIAHNNAATTPQKDASGLYHGRMSEAAFEQLIRRGEKEMDKIVTAAKIEERLDTATTTRYVAEDYDNTILKCYKRCEEFADANSGGDATLRNDIVGVLWNRFIAGTMMRLVKKMNSLPNR